MVILRIQLRSCRARSRRKRFLKTISHEEMQRLLSVYASEEELERDRAVALRNQAVLELLYACGLRVSEVEGLTLDRLHLDQGYVSVVGKGE